MRSKIKAKLEISKMEKGTFKTKNIEIELTEEDIEQAIYSRAKILHEEYTRFWINKVFISFDL